MRFPSTIVRGSDGQWSLRHESPEIGRVEVTAPTREQAVEKLRGEISYRIIRRQMSNPAPFVT
jgi:hypothetical protein